MARKFLPRKAALATGKEITLGSPSDVYLLPGFLSSQSSHAFEQNWSQPYFFIFPSERIRGMSCGSNPCRNGESAGFQPARNIPPKFQVAPPALPRRAQARCDSAPNGHGKGEASPPPRSRIILWSVPISRCTPLLAIPVRSTWWVVWL